MTAHRLTASGASLAHHCTWSFRGDLPELERTSGRAAQIGTLVHKLAELHLSKQPLDIPEADPTLFAEAKAIFEGPLKGLLDSRPWLSESGLVYDAANDVAADGPRRGEPGYSEVTATQIRATTDLVCIEGDTATVLDIKTGKQPSDAEQLMVQAVETSRRWNVKRVTVGYARALKTKLQILNEETLDEDALDAQAGRLGGLLRKIPIAEPTPGAHCWRCSAFSICPAKQDDQLRELEESGRFE
jgi:hypothetical protein